LPSTGRPAEEQHEGETERAENMNAW